MSASSRLFRRKVDRYDGQAIFIDSQASYELGSYLGGGASGVVYEGTDLRTDPTQSGVAIKILNPVGFKLMPSGSLQRCLVAVKGDSISAETRGSPLREDHVWWLFHPQSRQVIAAYEDPKYGTLREVPLPKCIEVWGWDGMGGGTYDDQGCNDEVLDKLASMTQDVIVDGIHAMVPRVPPKYVKWLRSRRSIYREISNMKKLGSHPNVIRLHEVLELIQDSKSTLFLVLELVTGGELFDRIKVGIGTTEESARRYFRELLSGVGCCHTRGVCHRDLKPENLLLSDGGEDAVLKIADFGLSAAFAMAAGGDVERGKGSEVMAKWGGGPNVNVRRLMSVVGSPHYAAPEVSQESLQGYDGAKADSWSAGIILYSLLCGSLPFGKELSQCPRFHRLRRWLASPAYCSSSSTFPNQTFRRPQSPPLPPPDPSEPNYGSNPLPPAHISTGADACLPWLFPSHVSPSARSLIIGLLQPEPQQRLSIEAATRHPWVTGAGPPTGTSPAGSKLSNRPSVNDAEGSVNVHNVLMQLKGIELSGSEIPLKGLTVRSPPPLPRLDEHTGAASPIAASPPRTGNS